MWGRLGYFKSRYSVTRSPYYTLFWGALQGAQNIEQAEMGALQGAPKGGIYDKMNMLPVREPLGRDKVFNSIVGSYELRRTTHSIHFTDCKVKHA